jgi:hypothetical protein
MVGSERSPHRDWAMRDLRAVGRYDANYGRPGSRSLAYAGPPAPTSHEHTMRAKLTVWEFWGGLSFCSPPSDSVYAREWDISASFLFRVVSIVEGCKSAHLGQ